jgi:hypothetical protein
MKAIRRPRISVEQLEQRDCPSITEVLSGSTLYLFGVPDFDSTIDGGNGTNPTGGLQVVGTGADTFQVTDAGNSLGHFAAQNIYLNLINHFESSILVDLAGNTLSGNLNINLGAGTGEPGANPNNSLGTGITSSTGTGTIGGNVFVRGGTGAEFVGLGETPEAAPAGGTTITIGGNATFFGNTTPDPTASPGNVLDTGAFYNTGQTVAIGGNLVTNGYSALGVGGGVIGVLTTIGGNLQVSGGNNSLNEGVFGDVGAGVGLELRGVTVGGNVQVTGSPASPLGDFVTMSASPAATIGGNLAINLGNGPNQVQLAGNVGGNVSIIDGNGGPATNFEGITATIFTGDGAFNVNGSMNVTLGNGNNVFWNEDTFEPGIAAANGFGVTVNGNLTVRVGNGDNDLGVIGATAFGNMNFTLGNGGNNTTTTDPNTAANDPNNATLDGNNAFVGGTFNWIAGNGPDSLTITSPSAGSVQYNVNVQMGAGGNSFTVGNAAGGNVTLTGIVNLGANVGANSFTQNPGATLGGNFILENAP